MRRHPPHHLSPALAKHPAGLDPEAGLGRSKSPQQRSVQAGKPVNSEQVSCSFSSIAFDQACGIQQRCCLIEQLLDVEGDFKALLMKARPGAGIGCAPRVSSSSCLSARHSSSNLASACVNLRVTRSSGSEAVEAKPTGTS